MKKIPGIFILLTVAACSSPDKICDCVKASKDLEEKSQSFFENSETGNIEELKKLRERKDAVCREFENMSGPEMKKRMESCK